jgi:hypothetical protein
MELNEGECRMMEMQSNLRAACMKQTIISGKQDRYILAANSLRAVVGC